METRELISKVRKIEIKTRRLVDEITGGAYHSVFKGRGIEFSEVREYIPGDDVRDIDWNVTARSGAVHIKKYTEERELTVILAVDISASSLFGTDPRENKREKMAECAALLAFSAIRNNDKVGLLLFSDRTELYLPPRSGRGHALRLIREMVACEPKGKGTDLNAALHYLAMVQKKRSVIFLISDFLECGDFEKNLKYLSRRHDTAAFRVQDPLEYEIPCFPGTVLTDLETGEKISFHGSRAAVRLYSDASGSIRKSSEDLFKRSKVDMIDFVCGEDPVKPMMKFFRTRQMRKSN